ncbi:hypothetical protein SprV_0301240000 [Sparganum proliferum]
MHDKNTLKDSLKRLQVNPETRKDFVQNRPAWRREMKTGAVIYKANWIAAAKAKGEARKSQAAQLLTVNSQALPTCPRCRRAFRVRIGPVGRLRTQCANDPTTSASSTTLASAANPVPTAILVTADHTSLSRRHHLHYPTPCIDRSGQHHHHHVFTHSPADGTTTDFTSTSNVINIPTSSSVESAHTCPRSDRTFTSHFGLVGLLKIRLTEAGKPVPGAPTYTPPHIRLLVDIANAHSHT